MAEIRIHREHRLGLAKARDIARQWAEQVESEFDMRCTTQPGKTQDTVSFTRSGVNGELVVAGDHFDLHAKLGFLLGAFSRTIETEILKNLDTLLGAAGTPAAAAKKAAAAAGKGAEKAAAPTPAKAAAKTAAKPATKAVPKKR